MKKLTRGKYDTKDSGSIPILSPILGRSPQASPRSFTETGLVPSAVAPSATAVVPLTRDSICAILVRHS